MYGACLTFSFIKKSLKCWHFVSSLKEMAEPFLSPLLSSFSPVWEFPLFFPSGEIGLEMALYIFAFSSLFLNFDLWYSLFGCGNSRPINTYPFLGRTMS